VMEVAAGRPSSHPWLLSVLGVWARRSSAWRASVAALRSTFRASRLRREADLRCALADGVVGARRAQLSQMCSSADSMGGVVRSILSATRRVSRPARRTGAATAIRPEQLARRIFWRRRVDRGTRDAGGSPDSSYTCPRRRRSRKYRATR